MKSETFDYSRFASVVRRDLRMSFKGWSTTIWAIAGSIGFIVYIFEADKFTPGLVLDGDELRHEHSSLLNVFTIVFWLLSVFGASVFGAGNATPGQRINNLMVPASTLEKFLARWVVSTPVMMVVACLCWEAVDMLRMAVELAVRHGNVAPPAWFWQAFGLGNHDGVGLWYWIMLFASQATMILGSMIWHKRAVFKTILACWVLNMIYSAVGMIAASVSSIGFNARKGLYMGYYSRGSEDVFLWLLVFWGAFCYAMTYMRMREQEVIDHM